MLCKKGCVCGREKNGVHMSLLLRCRTFSPFFFALFLQYMLHNIVPLFLPPPLSVTHGGKKIAFSSPPSFSREDDRAAACFSACCTLSAITLFFPREKKSKKCIRRERAALTLGRLRHFSLPFFVRTEREDQRSSTSLRLCVS